MDNVKYLLSAYFHQDWNHAHGSWQAVVDEFVSDDRTTVAAVPGEVDQLLAHVMDDVELGQLIMSLGCDYSPDEGDRVWLGAVRDRIATHLLSV
jgi:hypothetical protein